MKKTTEVVVRRIISYTPIKDQIVAFSEEIYHEETLKDQREGIAYLSEVTSVTKLDRIPEVMSDFPTGVIEIDLYKKELREVVRTIPMEFQDSYHQIEEMRIKNPYTYIESNGLENVELFYLSHAMQTVYDANKNLLPKAISFNYMNGEVDNASYDLNKVMEVLSSREDIFFNNGKEIKSIPYYNASEERDKHISFIWQPTEEDFNKVKHVLDKTYTKYDVIMKEIFGLEKLY